MVRFYFRMLLTGSLMAAVFFISYESIACGDNTQGGKRLCPALRIEGNKNPCIGSTEVYDIEPYTSHSNSDGGNSSCVRWTVYGGVIVGVKDTAFSPPYPIYFENCGGKYIQNRQGLVNVTIKWGVDQWGNTLTTPPQYG